jgi:hypothetical protein
MGKTENTLAAVLRGASDNNIGFGDLQNLLEALGFSVRIKGDHFIYTKETLIYSTPVVGARFIGRFRGCYRPINRAPTRHLTRKVNNRHSFQI